MPPDSRSLRLVFKAAGFMATSVLRRSPGVWMSRLLKWTWKPETPARVPAGARVSAGETGKGGGSVATMGGGVGELRPCQLHAVAGVAGEADGDRFQFLKGHVLSPGNRLHRSGRSGHGDKYLKKTSRAGQSSGPRQV